MAGRQIIIDPEVVSDEMAEILRRKTPTERLAITHGMWRFAQVLVRGGVKNQHPEFTEAEIERAVARRMSCGAV